MPIKKTIFEIQAELFGTLAHPARLEILELLRDGEACVCHIQAMLDQRQAYVSQHLNVLRQAGLVSNRKEGLRVYYQLSSSGVLDLIEGAIPVIRSLEKWPAFRIDPMMPSAPTKACNCPQCTPFQAS